MGNSKSKVCTSENFVIYRKYKTSPLLKEKLCEAQFGLSFEGAQMFWVDVNQRQYIPIVFLKETTKEEAEKMLKNLLNVHSEQKGSFVSHVSIKNWDDLKEEDFVLFQRYWRDDMFVMCFM
ncbi:hypothetical protein A9K97_gp324 [Tokyovirus A1]|uniref:hypothetical protein n=1 Tax=Tokyovirus A1 TaxID=1826170 RepID=UPI0007A9711C|nr:hypothetical protein A9K97_gp324 [Tokyovirus A1]BAU80027.1 hypothetical protein [Tokyovirus A1]